MYDNFKIIKGFTLESDILDLKVARISTVTCHPGASCLVINTMTAWQPSQQYFTYYITYSVLYENHSL